MISALIKVVRQLATSIKCFRLPEVNGMPVLTVKKFCRYLRIPVPNCWRDVKAQPVTATAIFSELEGGSVLAETVKTRRFSIYDLHVLKGMVRVFSENYRHISQLSSSDTQMLKYLISFLYIFWSEGFTPENFFSYRFYEKTIAEANGFIGWKYHHLIRHLCNDRKFRVYCSSRAIFNKTYRKWVHRDWLDTMKCTYQDFEEFLAKQPRFLIKPRTSAGGKGLQLGEASGGKRLFRELQRQRAVIEEIVTSHPDLRESVDSPLNTVRIFTLLKANGQVELMAAGIRFGKAGVLADNYHSGGFAAVVDVKTGHIISDAVDAAHVKHQKLPVSGRTIKGLQVPCWPELIEAVTEAATIVPQLRHIGWDIAITDKNQIEFIEGNTIAGFNVVQVPDQTGIKYRYEKPIAEIEALNRTQGGPSQDSLMEDIKAHRRSFFRL